MTELSYIFEHLFDLNAEPSFNESSTDLITYINPKRSATSIASNDMLEFMNTFIYSFSQVKLTEKDRTILLKSCIQLVKQLNSFNLSLIEDNNGMTPPQVLEVTSKFVQDRLFSVDAKYKRDKLIQENALFIAPKEIAIGTRYELRKKKTAVKVIKIPRLIQSKFQYISILKSIEFAFSNEQFTQTYFEYNRNEKHVCQPDKYIGFCCGSV